MATLAKVTAGDLVLATTHNQMIDEINTKVSGDFVKTEIGKLVGSAPETLDTLEELAQALTENKSVVDAVNKAIGEKADKVQTAASIKALETAGLTSDKHKAFGFDAASNSVMITYKDGTTAKAAVPKSVAVYG